MELSPKERTLFRSDSGELILTSRRVRFTSGPASRRKVVSLMLEHVTSCRLVAVSHPSLLIVAAVTFIGGVLVQASVQWPVVFYGTVIAAVLVVLYNLGRLQMIVIASPSAAIRLNVRRMKMEAAASLIDQVEIAAAEVKAPRFSDRAAPQYEELAARYDLPLD